MSPHMMGGGMHAFGAVWMIVIGFVLVIPFWRLSSRLGYPGALSLLILIPLVNLGFVYFLAFASWPRLGGEGASRAAKGSADRWLSAFEP